jgi:O-antigen ligase
METYRKICIWLLIAVLAWSPFPFGGAIFWAAALQEICIAICFGLWVISYHGNGRALIAGSKAVVVPLVLTLLVILWAWVQTLPIVPESWAHPLWGMAADTLHIPTQEVISINPWRTHAELLKLMSYVMACWLAFDMARHSENAGLILNAVICICAIYALYAFILAIFDWSQKDVFYASPHVKGDISGPFVQRNSFATYCGMGTVAAIAKLVADSSHAIVTGRGARQLALTLMQYVFGRGAYLLVAMVFCFAGVIASGSRAGATASLGGLIAMALVVLPVARHRASKAWAIGGALACILPMLLLVLFSGDTLANRLAALFDAGAADGTRILLWDAAWRMIKNAPLLGLGLGSFQDAYPLYAQQLLPYVMDKAHCDYLEFAAGIGVVAAAMWWGAMALVAWHCLRGVWTRRRDRVFPLVGFSACVIVAIHSSVDFSLQLPAVSLLFAVLLGVGCMQSYPTRQRCGIR